MLTKLVVLVSAIAVCMSHMIYVENRCPYTVWLGTFSSNQPHPLGGGAKLNPYGRTQFSVGRGWNGRFWPRTYCDNSGNCVTGNCGGILCSGRTGAPPATLAEFTFDGAGGLDFYDVSLVDGYNVQMEIVPVAGSYDTSRHDRYYCSTAGCQSDINAGCPYQQQVRHNGQVVACKSGCEAYNRDDYCCRGYYGTPDKCPPFPASQYFKSKCSAAYSYAYDDSTSTFTCKGGDTGYTIRFC